MLNSEGCPAFSAFKFILCNPVVFPTHNVPSLIFINATYIIVKQCSPAVHETQIKLSSKIFLFAYRSGTTRLMHFLPTSFHHCLR